jgi:hypothetical protein
VINGAYFGAPNIAVILHFYASPAPDPSGAGEGQQYLGEDTVFIGPSGFETFQSTLFGQAAPGEIITATATQGTGNTSEFSGYVVAGPLAVTNTNDSGPGSLRQALFTANHAQAGDSATIDFNIAGLGPNVINLASPLPPIVNPVLIDGTAQPGYAGLPLVELAGGGMASSGLTLAAGSNGSIVKGLDISSFAVGVTVEGGTSAMITLNTINATTGIVVGAGPSDTSSVTAAYDIFAGDSIGVQNNQSTVSVQATNDWWGSATGPKTSLNPGGTGAAVSGSVNFSPWLGDANVDAPDKLGVLSSAGNQYAVNPDAANANLNLVLGGSLVGTITGGGSITFYGTGGTVTITGESGPTKPDVFTLTNSSVQYSAADGLSGSTINFLASGLSFNVDAQGATNTFNINGAGGTGPVGTLAGDSGTNAFVFGATGKLTGSIQGAGSSTLNYVAYSAAVSINLGNGTNGTATGVSGTVSGITALIGTSHNDTLNAGTVPGVALTGGLGTNTLAGTGAGDSVVESVAASYTLTNAKLTGTSAAFTDNLTGITTAKLTGASSTTDTFTVTGWNGTGSLSAPAGSTATITDSAIGSFTLTNTQVSAPNTTLSLSGITAATFTDSSTSGGNKFTVSGWTGGGTLKGNLETLVDSVAAGVTLVNTSLAVAGSPALTLSGFTTANLTDMAGGNTFTVSGWTGGGSLTDSGSSPDTIAASKGAGYTLTNTSLSSTDNMSLALSGFATANLAATTTSKTFTVGGWTGNGSLSDTATGIVTASKNAGFTLSNTSLAATDGMALSLTGITTANLATTAASGSPSYIVDANAFTGVTNLTTGGTVSAIVYGGSGNNSTLSATGSGKVVLIGGAGKTTLTDTGTGHNIEIGGPGVDTLSGNGNDILISGTTSYDSDTPANVTALDAILAEWSSGDSYSTRINLIMTGIVTGSGTAALNSTTCQSDGVANTVKDGPSGAQNNWFIVNSKDKVTKQSSETKTIV